MISSIDGELPRTEIVRVLESHTVSVSNFDKEKNQVRLENSDGMVLVVALNQWVVRRVVRKISREFGIPIHHFYNSDMVV